MAMRHPEEELTLHQIMNAADKLPIEERVQLVRHLEFRACDEAWNRLVKEINENRTAKGLAPATNEEIHDELDARRTPEDWENLKRDIQIGIDQLDRGEGISGEQVFAELKERYKNFKKAAT